MQTTNIPLEKLIAYAGNPRKNDHAVEAVASAIKRFGFRVPVLAKSDGSLIDGHLRVKAAKHLGMKEVPVVLCDDLSEADIKALRKAERPGQIIFVVVTDGDENSSSEHTLKGVRSEVERLRKKSEWTFQFIGAGDSAWQGSEMGMNTTSAPANAHGFQKSYSTLNVRMGASRGPGAPRMSLPAFIRDDE